MDPEPNGAGESGQMVVDTDFSHVPMKQAGSGRRWRGIKPIVLAPLILSGLHMLGTGSPIPLWHIERLKNPVAVASVENDALVLADGRRVPLPFIKKLPKDDPLFARVLSHGVEVGDRGEVIGLIDPRRMCGNDPVVFYRKRIDLSELAGVLDPDGIDDAIVLPALIQDYKESHYSRSRVDYGMPYNVMGQAWQLRRIFESARDRLEAERSDAADQRTQGREVSRESPRSDQPPGG
jgi:hypothetical protein